jgi:hypothetical protein
MNRGSGRVLSDQLEKFEPAVEVCGPPTSIMAKISYAGYRFLVGRASR